MLKLQAMNTQNVWKVLSNSKPAHTEAMPNLKLNGEAEDSRGFESECKALRTALFPPLTIGNDVPALRPRSGIYGMTTRR